jgi:peroxiredoxin
MDMPTTNKLQAGSEFPSLTVPKAGGGEIKLGGNGGWQMLVVYRGKHCPQCRKYLKGLGGLLDDYKATSVSIAVVSGDPKEKAEAEIVEEGWHFPVGYALSQDQMRKLGLYISNPRSPEETDRPFPEPGLFVINPEGKAQIIDISNAPWSRPDLANILNGIRMIKERNYPIRGTAD